MTSRFRLPFDLRYDRHLLFVLLSFAVISLFVLYSASGRNLGAVGSQVFRYVLAMAIMLAIAQVRPETMRRYSPHIFGIGLASLLAVLIAGEIGKGAQRWLSLGLLNVQPSELMKLAVPMIVSWWIARDGIPPRARTLLIAGVFIIVPVFMIYKQPDLGTAVMILASGLIVLFLAGISWKLIIGAVIAIGAATPLVWAHMLDYQRARVLSFINPQSDPLGAGYHSIQSMIAVGSGGIFGKGWLDSSQAHLGYLPERTTDFVFAVFAEEFGLLGVLLLFSLYAFLIGRCLLIAYYAQDAYSRLLAGALSVTFFLYFFVNIGMVTGILPVVGVPLPLISYGGSSLVTLLAGFGILMSIQTHRKIVQH